MKIKEIRDLSGDELKQKEISLREESFRLRIRHATQQIDSTAAMGQIRRDIARIQTILREKGVRS